MFVNEENREKHHASLFSDVKNTISVVHSKPNILFFFNLGVCFKLIKEDIEFDC